MHAAPSVSFPVGRSAFAGRALAVLSLLGAVAIVGWCLQADAPGWRHAAAIGALVACDILAAIGWWRSPQGELRWDGLAWQWDEGGRVFAGRPELALDLQARLLVRWRGQGSAARWLSLERKSAPSHWDALRRALYSPASGTPAPPPAHSPPAEQ
jgi:toxin CptA